MSPKLSSQLLGNMAEPARSGLAGDFGVLVEFSDGDLGQVVDAARELFGAGRTTTAFERRVLDRLVADTEKGNADVTRGLNALRFVVRYLISIELEGDEVTAIREDLVALIGAAEPGAGTGESAIGDILGRALNLAAELTPLSRRTAAERGVLPVLRSVGTTVELRAILTEEYQLGEPVESYQPELEGYVPVVSVALGLQLAAEERVCFQLDLDSLDYLIDTLRAAKKVAIRLKPSDSHTIGFPGDNSGGD